MNNNLSNVSSIYVDINSLINWSSKFDSINENSINSLNSLLSTIDSLNDCWIGNVATGFIEDGSSFVKSVQKTHNEMKDVASFLIEVGNTMSDL